MVIGCWTGRMCRMLGVRANMAVWFLVTGGGRWLAVVTGGEKGWKEKGKGEERSRGREGKKSEGG